MKDELRKRAIARIRSIPLASQLERGEAIASHLWTVPRIAEARTLLAYASVPGEVPTGEIIAEARRRGIVTAYPRCVRGTREMTLHAVRSSAQLTPGTFGILEPDESCPALPLHEIDAALIPGLAWDRFGDRLGRGAGYYDRLLGDTAWQGFVCGLFFADQEMDRIPSDPWDVKMDAVVTEDGVQEMREL